MPPPIDLWGNIGQSGAQVRAASRPDFTNVLRAVPKLVEDLSAMQAQFDSRYAPGRELEFAQ